MGIHGNATCVMNFDAATGFLIGPPNKGLNCMFTFMNTARLGTRCKAWPTPKSVSRAASPMLAASQMRSLTGPKAPEKPADPIIVHPDVRRMLLTMKAFAEGNRAMLYFAAKQVDIVQRSQDEEQKKAADSMLAFLTPIAKAFMTEVGFESANHGVQIFGGHGFIAEHGMEQNVRDSRISMLYEGTTGVQALDLLGRKVLMTQGEALKGFTKIVHKFCQANEANEAVKEFVAPLAQLNKEWGDLTMKVGMAAMKDREEVGAASVDYLMYSGYACLAYFGPTWRAWPPKLAAGTGEEALQGQAADRALLLPAHPAAYLRPRRRHAVRRQQPDGDGRGRFRPRLLMARAAGGRSPVKEPALRRAFHACDPLHPGLPTSGLWRCIQRPQRDCRRPPGAVASRDSRLWGAPAEENRDAGIQGSLRDMRFLIDEVFDFHGRYQALGASDATPDMVAAILDEGSKFCEQVLAPLNRSGDEEGCHFDNGVVSTPKGFKEAYAQYVEGGWNGVASDPAYGGQGLPHSLGLLLSEMIGASNVSWACTRPDPRRHVGDPRPRQPGAEGPLPGADDRRHLDRHHVPDRALRHRPASSRPARCRTPTAAMRSAGRRSSSPPASTT